jgi:sigma-B regulation protein RsbU (phosphoserine phosphatase)
VLEAHRALSRSRTDLEMIDAVGSRFRAITEASHIVGLDVRAVPPGSFRIRAVLAMPDSVDGGVSVVRYDWDQTPAPTAIETGPVIADLISGDAPRTVSAADPAHDPVLATLIDGPHDCLSVPIFVDGEIAEWMLLFREAGRGFTAMDARLAASSLNLLARTAIQLNLTEEVRSLHAELRSHLDDVAAVQRSLLPQELPDVPGLSMAARYRPSVIAGGDTYDLRWFGPRTLGVAVADVAGHGPAAAVVMGMLRAALTAHLLHDESPGPVVPTVNRIMHTGLNGSTFITAIFLAIDLDSGEVNFANAGHPAARVLRAATGAVEAVASATTIPLGIMPELPGDGGRFSLEPGDVLVAYTDGISEAFSPDRRQFGEAGLDAAIAAAPRGADPDTIADAIMRAVRAHEAGAPQADDQCLVVLRRDPAT